MNNFRDGFVERLKKARNEAGMTQRELSEKSGIPLSTLAAYENEKRTTMPDAESLSKISTSLGKSIDWLCGMDAEQHEEKEAKEEKITSEQWLRYFLRILNAPQITEGYITTSYEADAGCRETTRPNMELVNHIDVNGRVADFACLDDAVATVNFYGIAMGDLFKKLAIIKSVSSSLPDDMRQALVDNAVDYGAPLFDIDHAGENEFGDFHFE